MIGGFGFIFTIVFLFIAGSIILNIVKGVKQYAENIEAPLLSMNAKVVGKRDETRRRNHNVNGTMTSSTSTSYYVTFQSVEGMRIELELKGKEYGLLVEGDEGILSYQGTWYKGFERGVYEETVKQDEEQGQDQEKAAEEPAEPEVVTPTATAENEIEKDSSPLEEVMGLDDVMENTSRWQEESDREVPH